MYMKVLCLILALQVSMIFGQGLCDIYFKGGNSMDADDAFAVCSESGAGYTYDDTNHAFGDIFMSSTGTYTVNFKNRDYGGSANTSVVDIHLGGDNSAIDPTFDLTSVNNWGFAKTYWKSGDITSGSTSINSPVIITGTDKKALVTIVSELEFAGSQTAGVKCVTIDLTAQNNKVDIARYISTCSVDLQQGKLVTSSIDMPSGSTIEGNGTLVIAGALDFSFEGSVNVFGNTDIMTKVIIEDTSYVSDNNPGSYMDLTVAGQYKVYDNAPIKLKGLAVENTGDLQFQLYNNAKAIKVDGKPDLGGRLTIFNDDILGSASTANLKAGQKVVVMEYTEKPDTEFNIVEVSAPICLFDCVKWHATAEYTDTQLIVTFDNAGVLTLSILLLIAFALM